MSCFSRSLALVLLLVLLVACEPQTANVNQQTASPLPPPFVPFLQPLPKTQVLLERPGWHILRHTQNSHSPFG